MSSPPEPAPSSGRFSLGVRAIAALIVGFTVGAIAAEQYPPLASVLLSIADPVGTIWVNGIRMTVIPLVVSLLITGIASASDLRAVGRIGGRALLLFLALLSALSLFTALVAPPMYSLLHVDPAAAAALRERVTSLATTPPELPSFTSWLTSLVPVNPIKSAVDGAMLPLIVFTVCFALGVARLSSPGRESILIFFRGTAEAMLILVRWILALAPLGILALAVALGARMGLDAAGAIGFYLMAHSLLALVAALLLYPAASIFGRVPLTRFAKAVLPAQVVAMSTRSSLAALPAMLDSAEHRLHLSREVSGFVLPLAVSTFRLNQVVSWLASGLFIAKLYGVPFGVSSIATFAVASVFMSFSVPGIPSGGVVMMTPFFATVGLPVEAIGVLIALDVIPDLFKTMLNVTGQMTSAVVLARPDREDA